MAHTRILCNCSIVHIPEAKLILESVGDVTYAEHKYPQLLEVIGDYDALLPSLDIHLDKSLLQRAKRLKLIATPSTGTDHIDLRSAAEFGIEVMSLKNDIEFLKKVTATAELAFGLILSITRRIPFAFDSAKQAKWSSRDFRGHELLDKTLGIIGYGRLGEMMARYAHAFGMHVSACDPYKTIREDFVTQVDFETLLRSADILTVHVHLNEETRGLISERAVSTMKQGVFLVNTSRGAVIDEAALLRALESGKLAGAALDVICGELEGDFENHPLIQYAQAHDNLILTPHVGGVTYESQAKAYAFTARKIQRFFSRQKTSEVGQVCTK
jgi:D-3-phosphoglycerate dehydrogenase